MSSGLRLAVSGLGLALLGWGGSARADSTEAYCLLSRHDQTIPVESGPCQFSQRQGNVSVLMGRRWAFRFDADQQGTGYQRSNSEQGIRFSRDGNYTLDVLWRRGLQCKGPIQEPVSVVYLGNGDQSKAHLAVGGQQRLIERAISGSGARYTGPGLELWEHQGETRINWYGTTLTCSS